MLRWIRPWTCSVRLSCATRSSKQRIRHIVASSDDARAASDSSVIGVRRRGYAATGADPSTPRTAPAIFSSSGSTNASIGSL